MKTKSLSQVLGRLVDLTLINSGSLQLNDFSSGSVINSIYESISMELEMLYMLQRENILWGIGEGVYEAFDFERRDAQKAYGELTIEFNTVLQTPTYISRGSQFSSTVKGYQQQYETLEDFLVPAGISKTRVTVYCTDPGEVGNVPKSVINQSKSNIMNLRTVYNEQDFLTGTDKEPLEKVKRRFRAFVDTRGRATNKSLRYATRSVPEITGVYIREESGYIRVYAHDKNGNLPQDIQSDVESALENYRPSGIKLDVLPVERKEIDISMNIKLRDNSRNNTIFKESINQTIRNYLNRMEASEDLILNDLSQQVMNVDDFVIYDLTFNNLDKNIQMESHQIIRAGNIQVNFSVL